MAHTVIRVLIKAFRVTLKKKKIITPPLKKSPYFEVFWFCIWNTSAGASFPDFAIKPNCGWHDNFFPVRDDCPHRKTNWGVHWHVSSLFHIYLSCFVSKLSHDARFLIPLAFILAAVYWLAAGPFLSLLDPNWWVMLVINCMIMVTQGICVAMLLPTTYVPIEQFFSTSLVYWELSRFSSHERWNWRHRGAGCSDHGISR